MDDDPSARARIEEARREIAVSLDELRDVARGLHPAVLSAHGLAVALESLAATSPVPVRLTSSSTSGVDEQVEVAAYYVVSESLANIGKHAQAASATVDIVRHNGDLVVEVVDDGVGGADTERARACAGSPTGSRRSAAACGSGRPRGGGTRVRAEMPCA